MAAVPIYIVGTITTAAPKSGEVDPSGIKQCVVQGLASIEGLGVGGGPIYPPEKPPIDSGAHPEHPIYYPPGSLPHPEHPIALPPDKPPTEPPTEPPTNPADPQWVWGWTPKFGGAWVPVYVPGPGQAGPKV